ncbi:MAG TPA: DUF5647 family protein [Candidatus Binatia bacterium]|jgi:hypothetical protein|nr:DUF5647 family protein [Candidatus Binatia bacterium]
MQVVVRKNLLLGIEFDKYLIEHPKLIEKIPQGTHVVLLPEYDPELFKANMRLARKRLKEGEKVVFVRVEKLSPPAKSRLIRPRIEVAESV